MESRAIYTLFIAAAGLLGASGCAVRDDPQFNPYAPADGEPTVMQRAEDLVGALEQAVDDIDQRLENAVQ